jgi:hypothetical protein
MNINKKEFHDCVKKLIKDPDLQKIESENFIFLRPNGTITVKFKNIDKLTGYFSIDEIKNWKTLKIILKTLEKELGKKEN